MSPTTIQKVQQCEETIAGLHHICLDLNRGPGVTNEKISDVIWCLGVDIDSQRGELRCRLNKSGHQAFLHFVSLEVMDSHHLQRLGDAGDVINGGKFLFFRVRV